MTAFLKSMSISFSFVKQFFYHDFIHVRFLSSAIDELSVFIQVINNVSLSMSQPFVGSFVKCLLRCLVEGRDYVEQKHVIEVLQKVTMDLHSVRSIIGFGFPHCLFFFVFI